MLSLLSCLLLQAVAAAPPSPLLLELRVGAVTTFGDAAERGTQPFAQLRTISGLGRARLLTWTRLTAAPGAEFDLSSAATFQALDFEVAGAYKRLVVVAGAQAKAFEPDEPATPAARRAGFGLHIDSTTRTWFLLAAGFDERQAGSWGAWIGAGAEIAPGISLIGTATIGRTSTTMRLAAAAGWK